MSATAMWPVLTLALLGVWHGLTLSPFVSIPVGLAPAMRAAALIVTALLTPLV